MLREALLLGLLFFLVGAIPTERDRGPKDLSDKQHYDGEHNVEYDHEAFLGKEQAAEFDKLTHEEAKRRLRLEQHFILHCYHFNLQCDCEKD